MLLLNLIKYLTNNNELFIKYLLMNYLTYKNKLLTHLHNLPKYKFTQPDIQGNYILHTISAYADIPSIKYCIDQYPDALELYNKKGMLPIHIALTALPPNEDAARIMIHINPGLGLAYDDKGRSISDLRGKHSDSLWMYNYNCCFPWF
jgi:hypothetical protein